MDRDNENEHGKPAVMVQVPDIGMGIPGIQAFCNKPSHYDCKAELDRTLRTGGRIVISSYWERFYRKE